MIVTSTTTVAIYYGVCSTVIAGKSSAEVLPAEVLMFRITAICNYVGMTTQPLDLLLSVSKWMCYIKLVFLYSVALCLIRAALENIFKVTY